MSSDAEQMLAWRRRYINDCESFVRDNFKFPNPEEVKKGWDIYDWQKRIMRQYDQRRRLISIRSGHGVGKTTLAAWILWHHILCLYPQRTAVTAPTEKQLFNALWADFRSWGDRLPKFLREQVDLKADRAELKVRPADSYISVTTARKEQPEALQGIHSMGHVLLWADEASGVAEQVFEAGLGSMSGENAITILTGNPVRGNGFFYNTHTKLQELWHTDKVSCIDLGTAISNNFANEVATIYGRDSNAYRVRVLGEFPTKDDDTVIPFELVEASFERDIIIPKLAPVIWGVDPARFGSDRSALAKRQTRQLLEPIKWWTKLDTMELSGRIKLEYDTTPKWLQPQEICIDSIGIGAGVVDRTRELGLPVRGINVSEMPAAVNAERYSNLRTELWFKGLEWFAGRDVLLPSVYRDPKDGADLLTELTAVKYRFDPKGGKVRVESKEDMKKRGMRSPDLADAFLLTFATDAITLMHGSYGATSWKKKIARPLKGIA